MGNREKNTTLNGRMRQKADSKVSECCNFGVSPFPLQKEGVKENVKSNKNNDR